MVVSPPRERKTPLGELLKATSHKVKTFGEHLVCTKCLNGYNKKDPAIRPWLTGACLQSRVQSTRPVNICVDVPMHIGNQSVHHTHSIRQHRGFIFCKKCGSRAITKVCKLAHQCEPPTQFGKATLAAIANEWLPPKLSRWPSESLGLSLPGGL